MFDRKILVIVAGAALLPLTGGSGVAASVGHGGPSWVRVRPSRRWVQILQILERQVTEDTDGVTGAAGAIGTLTPVIAAKSKTPTGPGKR